MNDFKNFENERMFLSTVDGKMFDVCHRFYELYLKSEPDKNIASQKLSLLLCWDKQTDKTNPLSPICSIETYKEKIEATKDTVNTILGNLIKQKPDVSKFYLDLWEEITRKTLFATDLDTVAAIIYLCSSSRIPYYKLNDGLKMDDEEFERIVKGSIEYLRKMLFVLSVGYEQRTEVASLLMSVLDEVKDYNTKVVLFANIMSFCEIRAAQALKQTEETTTSED